jgi:predicted CXXCH cytochrome family protein
MKRLTQALLVVALGLLVVSSAGAYTGTYTPGTGINGTPHDLGTAANGMNYVANPPDVLTGLPGNPPGNRICIFCHAPHNTYRLSPANGGPGAGVGAGPQAPDAFDYLPLWNHELTPNWAGYTMYQNGPGAPQTGPKASQAINNGMVLGSVSLLCMSCHDGAVAVNAYGNADQLSRSWSNAGGATIGAQYLVGKDSYLGNHHPIGFDYDAAQAIDTEIRPATGTPMGGAPGVGDVRDHLYGSQLLGSVAQMECGTCHSVHNTGNSGETLLWRSDQNSRLCLTCHAKGTAPGTTTP